MLPSREAQRHPRLEFLDHSRLHFRMLVEVVVQPVGERVHQRLQPRRTLRVLLLQRFGIDEQLHPQVLVDFGLALGLRQPSHRVDVVRLDAIEVVLGLRVLHAEDSVGVRLSVDVRDAPIVADDGDIPRFFLPARGFRVLSSLGRKRDARNREHENELLHICHHCSLGACR